MQTYYPSASASAISCLTIASRFTKRTPTPSTLPCGYCAPGYPHEVTCIFPILSSLLSILLENLFFSSRSSASYYSYLITSASFFWFFSHWLRLCHKSHIDTLPPLFLDNVWLPFIFTSVFNDCFRLTNIERTTLRIFPQKTKQNKTKQNSKWGHILEYFSPHFPDPSVNHCLSPCI